MPHIRPQSHLSVRVSETKANRLSLETLFAGSTYHHGGLERDSGEVSTAVELGGRVERDVLQRSDVLPAERASVVGARVVDVVEGPPVVVRGDCDGDVAVYGQRDPLELFQQTGRRAEYQPVVLFEHVFRGCALKHSRVTILRLELTLGQVW